VLVAALLATGCASTDPGVVAREASPIAPRDRSADPVPQDPDVRIVTLANGLTVYLRANDRPGESAEMRLVINAGSGEEESDQSGTAHFLEHMMFNGTTKYPANELIDTLRGFGMQFGADVNAFTSYDETVYELTVPLSDSANLDTGIDVLREWLSAATLDADQVESEKGVVLDEWRQRDQTLDGRIGDAAEELLLQGSGYEGRRPIGSDTAIKAMTPGLLRRFYDTPRFFGFGDAQGALFFGLFDLVRIDQEGREAFGFFEFGFVFGGFELALERADANALPEAAFGHVGGLAEGVVAALAQVFDQLIGVGLFAVACDLQLVAALHSGGCQLGAIGQCGGRVRHGGQ